VGTVDERTQEWLASLLIAVTGQDPDQLVDEFLELGVAKRQVDRNLLREDLWHLISRYY
jgi:ubiquinone biosynthesis protein